MLVSAFVAVGGVCGDSVPGCCRSSVRPRSPGHQTPLSVTTEVKVRCLAVLRDTDLPTELWLRLQRVRDLNEARMDTLMSAGKR